ncbi:MAG TPA: hypothetical protein VN851_15485 [Thermoanaerobaculia bacterium]|nr:hypothetical protein [Thermoanaerobaculia bacterium]
MCTATLCVWITEIGDPCHIIKEQPGEKWYVHIVDCEGNVLEWCGRKFRDIETKCGHAEIKVPPGCYTVFASHSKQGEGLGIFGNRLTHVQVVRANCDDRICVTLFSPALWFCGTWFAAAVRQQTPGLLRLGLDRQAIKGALTAIDLLLERVPVDPFAKNLQAFQERTPPPPRAKGETA